MNTENTRLHDLINIKSPSDIFAEIIKILSLVDPSLDPSLIENVFKDIIRLFSAQ